MRDRLIIAGNWKMNLNQQEAEALSRAVAEEASRHDNVDVAIFPPFPWLLPARQAAPNVVLGAQNCYSEPSGAYTGEVSAAMLAPICDAVLAGHSERRHVFTENDDLVGKKIEATLSHRMTAYLCVGETIEQRESGQAESVASRQLAAGLDAVPAEMLDQLVIAYEPVWAIGTGVAATAADAQEMAAYVRNWMVDRFGRDGAAVSVLYGGSVNPENAAELFSQTDVDGGLVGGASLKADTFNAIIATAAELRRM